MTGGSAAERVAQAVSRSLVHAGTVLGRRWSASYPEADRGRLPFAAGKPTTNPILPVADMDEASAFYERLGFEVTRYDDAYAWVNHCGWEWCHLRLVTSTDGNQASAYFHVADADAWHTAMSTAGAATVAITPPTDMPWGLREFSVTDPDGNVVRIGSPSGG